MSNLIIDVSYHNGVINWERVKASGCAGAILRIIAVFPTACSGVRKRVGSHSIPLSL